MSSRELILQKIKQALHQSTPKPYSNVVLPSALYHMPKEAIEIIFAEAFISMAGQLIYCETEAIFFNNLTELSHQKNWQYLYCWDKVLQNAFADLDFRKCRLGRQLDKAEASITRCEALVARTGSIVLSSKQAAGRSLPIYPPIHIVLAYTSQLVMDIGEAMVGLQKKYGEALPSMINIATGPSRTADIEKTLVLGAHGPKEVYLFLIDDIGGVV